MTVRRGVRELQPVSYTHLDVYKRQRLDTVAERLQKSISAFINFVFVCLLVLQTTEQ